MLEQILLQLRSAHLCDSSIKTLATQILGLKERDVAASLFAMLNHEPSEELITNVLAVFVELVVRNATWAHLITKSVEKKGRCPQRLRSSIRRILNAESKRLARRTRSVRDLIADFETVLDESSSEEIVSGVKINPKRTLFRSGKTIATIPISTDHLGISCMEAIASMLCSITDGCDEVILDFDGVSHVYVVGLSALIAWCKARGITPDIVNDSDRVGRYLDLVGYTRAIRGGSSASSEADPIYTMALEPLSKQSPTEQVAKKLVDIVDHHMHLSGKGRTALTVVFGELIENIQRHAGPAPVAYACAQVYPRRQKLTICVVDTGMGIRQSIMTSTNESLKKRISNGDSAVRSACAPLVTSKPDRHSGYGLYVASELVVRNGGTFRIFSDDEVFTCYRQRWRRMENLNRVSAPWRGTWIAMILDLDAVIPVDDVYSTLPPAPGTELQDFF